MAEKATFCKCYYSTYCFREMRFQTIPGRAADAIQTVTPKNGMVRQDNLYEYMKLLAIFFS